jgi:hypothetical protein
MALAEITQKRTQDGADGDGKKETYHQRGGRSYLAASMMAMVSCSTC